VVLDDGTHGLVDNFGEECYGSVGTAIAQIFAWLILFVCCVGLPVYLILRIRQNYHSVGRENFLNVKSSFYYDYGFLYQKFLPEKYWFLSLTTYSTNLLFAVANSVLNLAAYNSRFANLETTFRISFPTLVISLWALAWIYSWPARNMDPVVTRAKGTKFGIKMNFGSGYVNLSIVYFELAVVIFTALSTDLVVLGLLVFGILCLLIALTYRMRVMKGNKRQSLLPQKDSFETDDIGYHLMERSSFNDGDAFHMIN
jgi:hypothetical protein